MLKYPILTKCECQNWILNIKMAYFDSAPEGQNSLFQLIANVEIEFRMSK